MIPVSFVFTPNVHPTFVGHSKCFFLIVPIAPFFYRVNALISTRILVSLNRAPHVLPTFEGQLKWFDRTNCHGFIYRVKTVMSARIFGSQYATL